MANMADALGKLLVSELDTESLMTRDLGATIIRERKITTVEKKSSAGEKIGDRLDAIIKAGGDAGRIAFQQSCLDEIKDL